MLIITLSMMLATFHSDRRSLELFVDFLPLENRQRIGESVKEFRNGGVINRRLRFQTMISTRRGDNVFSAGARCYESPAVLRHFLDNAGHWRAYGVITCTSKITMVERRRR